MTTRSAFNVLALAFLAVTGHAQAPDTILVHGNVLTGKSLSAVGPSANAERVQALAIRTDRIVAVGDDAKILALKDAHTQIIDLHGAFAMPGFNDAHTHIASAGQQRLSVDLDNTASLAEAQTRIKAYAAKLGPGQWVLGGGWDHTKWPTKALPTRQNLDCRHRQPPRVPGAHRRPHRRSQHRSVGSRRNHR